MYDIMYEVYRNGKATNRLFCSRQNAEYYISQQHDDAIYTIEPYYP